ncbi:hypothetical protein, partial [uncultured Bilophila sp.]|uniref:hypothetical protein n=1 Tax=uncultured Bilophila sp. TaxID=529385 RepID=UPI0026DC5EFC
SVSNPCSLFFLASEEELRMDDFYYNTLSYIIKVIRGAFLDEKAPFRLSGKNSPPFLDNHGESHKKGFDNVENL